MDKKRSWIVRPTTAAVWDCGSTLYDSFELDSLRRQLDSALSARSLSMPHLSDDVRRRCAPSGPKGRAPRPSKKHSLVPRSLLRLFRSVFMSTPTRRHSSDVRTSPSHVPQRDEQSKQGRERNRVLVMGDKRRRALVTIPEEVLGEKSPDISAFVRKTASERLSTKLIGVPCT